MQGWMQMSTSDYEITYGWINVFDDFCCLIIQQHNLGAEPNDEIVTIYVLYTISSVENHQEW